MSSPISRTKYDFEQYDLPPTPTTSTSAPLPNAQPNLPPLIEPNAPNPLATRPRREAKRISQAIDRQINRERVRKDSENSLKMLILGAAESGKTTVLKQIRLLHGDGLADRSHFKHIIYLNILNAIRSLAVAMLKNQLPLANPENADHLHTILNLEPTPEATFMNGQFIASSTGFDDTPSIVTREEEYITSVFKYAAGSAKVLWLDDGIKDVWKLGLAGDLQDTAKHFLDSIDRIASDYYTPTDDDIIQARVRTLGVSEHRFFIDKHTYIIYDVGGHRSQRKYWAPYFDNCNAILFLAAISSFDQTLSEDPSINRLTDSVDLFRSICNHPLLKKSAMILFLNKTDILQMKLDAGIRVGKFFPEYKGSNDFESIANFFRRQFTSQKRDADKEIYVHLTHATDTQQMRMMVAALNVIVAKTNLTDAGLL
ncbi:uncharacterized protein VTP21DRAFT_3151 [Calcarisporiella thermophila]|uniref:uncharacterized protein n=1 Tax=Calcarisporiella thermophila TaxID=911321 RepID=UPI0037445E64